MLIKFLLILHIFPLKKKILHIFNFPSIFQNPKTVFFNSKIKDLLMEIKGYWGRKERSKPSGWYIQRESWRRNIEPYGDGWSTSFDYPTTLQTTHFLPDRVMGDVVDRYLHNPSYISYSGMRHMKEKGSSKDAALSCYITLKKDGKLICRTKCTKPPIEPSLSWNVDIVKRTAANDLQDFPRFFLYPAFERHNKENAEWIKFLTFLYKYNKVATVLFDDLKIYVLPPESNEAATETTDGLYFDHAVVVYELKELCGTSVNQKHVRSGFVLENAVKVSPDMLSIPPADCIKDAPAVESNAHVKENSYTEKGTSSSISKCHEAVDSTKPFSIKVDVSPEKSYVHADPSYLKTLGQAHSSWIFGAIAELVDNSKDAKASRLNIAIETILDKTLGSEIPMLSVIDDGNGMNHLEILRMISFGHKQLDEDNANHIGTFGIGFKTGSMRLGKDALVLTQTTDSRSVAFLSQSLNEGNDNLQIPVVSYRRRGQCMEIDTNVQSKELAKYNLNAIKEFSPFDEYLIGEKAGLFRGSAGTQIYIWNLDKWGSNYTLEWQEGIPGGSSFNQGDIFVRSRRVRTRPGQTSRKVHLDYSLRSYLEVIFLEPRMKIYVQGSLVKSRPLAKSLNNTVVLNAEIMGKQVQLTLGRCRIEWDEANGGIFLYWRGRLIEDDENGCVWVHNNKQGFQDCEQYACLEEWLGREADGYWDKYFDAIELRTGNSHYKPDNEWVQCDKCRKWRMLSSSFNSKNLPKEWFCYMKPFNGRCNMPEEQLGQGVITVGLKRSCHDPSLASNSEQSHQIDNDSPLPEGKDQHESTLRADHDLIVDVVVERPVLKRLRRRPPRYC
ncbi:uncharacterized protein LOC130821267 isoform X2 [Amaranthus tricolor]|uniref:uncharacterized protein LOC130821267 isoform X2 n=2 Tax=Amaranthus tricolor TaxID=29722 RepID=UPI00258CC67F|nr:uncharacterized protein LOC130821267 isoform X2 [Amaranthus tricolor]